MEDKQLNEKESLDLIASMIRNTQNKLEGDAGSTSILVWGYVTIAVTLAVWLTIHFTGHDYWHFLWFAIPVLGVLFTWMFAKKTKKGLRTYIDRVVTYVWVVLGIGCFLFSFASFFTSVPILTVVLLLVGSGSLITGLIIKFPALAVGGALSMAFSLVMLFIPQTLDYELLLFVLSFICMSIIPGHVLQAKARKAQQEVQHV